MAQPPSLPVLRIPNLETVVKEGERVTENLSDQLQVLQQAENRTEIGNSIDAVSDLGLTKSFVSDSRLRTALSNPQQYLLDKINDRVRIINDLRELFDREVKAHLENGESSTNARTKAVTALKALAKAKKEQHEAKFPDDITNKAEQARLR